MRESIVWVLVAILGLIILITLVYLLTMPSPAASRAPLCASSPQEADELLVLVRKGLDQAVVEHTAGLFRASISGGVELAGRANQGLESEARGYLYARRVIGAWVIPVCKP